MVFVAWEVFSLVYYGQLVPNTALAKLPPGVSVADLAGQGLRYFAATFSFDPFTLALLAIALVGLVSWGGGAGRIVACGVGLHLLYVITAGGDFMTGRFLTPAFALAVAGAAAIVEWPATTGMRVAAAGVVVALSLLWPGSPVRSDSTFGAAEAAAGTFVERFGVTDERRFYYPSLGLMPVLSGRVVPADHTWAATGLALRAAGQTVREASNTGLVGYYAGPDVYIIDRNALSDPFLARLPPRPGWRVGHYQRDVPADYVESRRQNQNLLQDPSLQRLYDRVERLTRGPIWSAERLRAIAGR
jgi:arabinofuranosyltransferase